LITERQIRFVFHWTVMADSSQDSMRTQAVDSQVLKNNM